MTIAPRLAAAALLCAPGFTASAATFDEVYAFGDSLNDCCVTGPFTNGPETWIPGFAAAIGADYPSPETSDRNYAVGGAQSGPTNVILQTDVDLGGPTGLQSQIDAFEATGPTVGDDDLAIVWAGTNDVWSAAFASPSLFGLAINQPLGPRPAVDALADYVSGQIWTGVERLRDAGFGAALVLTPFDVSQSALTDGEAETSALQEAYSRALRDRLFAHDVRGVDIWTLDMVALIEELQAGAPGNGFTALTGFDPCQPAGAAPGVCEARPQSEQDGFIFYDAVHLTTATNAIVAARAAALVSDTAPIAPVPLPAPGALLFGAFAALGLAGRRRAR